MKRVCVALLVAIGCGGNTTTAPYVYATSVIDPFDPFVIHIDYEPSAGHVDIYTVEARPAGGAYVDLARSGFSDARSAEVDLSPVAPNGGIVELRVRADPGAFESNVVRYDAGTALSTVSVSPKPDRATKAFLVHFGNRNGQVSLQRRVTNGGGAGSGAASGPYVTIATGTGPDTLYADADLSAYVDGALYEYQAISSTPGSIPSRSAKTDRTPLNAPSLVSYLPAASGATIVVRNNSSFSASVGVERLRLNGSILEGIGFASPVAPGATASFVDPNPPSLAHLGIDANSGVAVGSADVWAALQPPLSPLQPTVTTLQAGSSAARDPAGNFCIVEAFPRFDGQLAGSAVFAPGDSGAPLSLSIQRSVRCLVDSAGHSHVIWYQPGSPGKVMHAEHDGAAWVTEVIASPPSLSPFGQEAPQSDVAFDFGLDGTLFAAWYADANTIQLASRTSNQTWTIENVPASPEFGFLVVSGDEAGVPHLLTLEFFGNYHLFKAASGWTAELIPSFQIGGCSNAVMSVAGGFVSFISNEPNIDRQATLVRQTSAGWDFIGLGSGVRTISRSFDGHGFIVIGDANFQQSTVVIARDGVVTSAMVPSAVSADAGFSFNGKAWVVLWTDAPLLSPASPADPIAAFIFDER
jgi:hypothetical protein